MIYRIEDRYGTIAGSGICTLDELKSPFSKLWYDRSHIVYHIILNQFGSDRKELQYRRLLTLYLIGEG